ncbi:SWR1-complex protein 5 like [Verticillium longisporum]|uniref:SWR1-complex protein 5 n=1 Tax=Verticillium longisporum TaxID=100787 RepID=A0A8I2ZHQ3_VERLO|nr:SWR1-complex protein 5 like [Verticillium longisporum]
MPPDPRPIDGEDDYESSQDSDFAPEDEAALAHDDSGGSDADDADAATKRKRPAAAGDEAEDAGFENSGDEAIVKKGNKKKKRRKEQNGIAADKDGDEEGGEGGLVKTRSMRAQEKEEKKAATIAGPVTVDEADAMDLDAPGAAPAPPEAETDDPSSMIRIKRTYNFAGKVHTEEKLVPRDSAEAKLHLAAQGDVLPTTSASDEQETPRVLRRAFRSAFEPVVDVLAPTRKDLNLGVTVRIRARDERDAQEAKKLNTVEKSRMDWAGYVDKEGLKDELELAGRSKDSYAGRQDFLARSEALREEEAYRARMAGRV